MKRDFIHVSKKFFKKQIQQTKWILAFHLHVVKSIKKNQDDSENEDEIGENEES